MSSLRHPRSAFTLIEVVISLGIISTGMLLLFALVPGALNTMWEGSKKSVERRIANNMIGELLLNEWGQLHAFDSALRHFDSQGLELDASSSGEAIFTARVLVSPRDVRIDHDDDLDSIRGPGWTPPYRLADDLTPVSAATALNLRRVVVEITDLPDPGFDFEDPQNEGRFRRYASIVANTGDSDTPYVDDGN